NPPARVVQIVHRRIRAGSLFREGESGMDSAAALDAAKSRTELIAELALVRTRLETVSTAARKSHALLKKLRQSRDRYRLLAENVRDVIWTADFNFNYTY